MEVSNKVYDYLITPKQEAKHKTIEIPIEEFYNNSSGSLSNKDAVYIRLRMFIQERFKDIDQKNILIDIENKGAGNYYLIVELQA